MRVTIDRNGCISCGSCAEVCPDVFKMDVDGKASINDKIEGAEPAGANIPGDMNTCAENASSSCPVNVISLD